MTSDKKRLDQVYQHIARIKASDFPAIVGYSFDGNGYRVEERPFHDLAEPAKLAILQEAVDWSGVTYRDKAVILLSEIDLNKITPAQRARLNEEADRRGIDHSNVLRDALFADAKPQPQPDHSHERGRTR